MSVEAEKAELAWHLDPGSGPKRILALDGGGVRGLITLGMLQRIEDILKARCPRPDDFRLCHYFDLIAGTSTGSIIATALALGMPVAKIKRLYEEICPIAFKGRALGIFRPVYDHRPVEAKLQEVLEDERLQSPRLKTGLMICSKRLDTGSPWVLTNNPRSKYWDGGPDGKARPNREYELWMMIRASAAAPFYFRPVEVTIAEKGHVYAEDTGQFVDGGVAGLNNPSLQALLVATLPSYGFGWRTGPDDLMMISLGTGWWRQRYEPGVVRNALNLLQATEALAAMIQDTVLHTITAMQAISTPRKPWRINGEIEHMRGERTTREDVLRFQRWDAMLEQADVASALGMPDPASKKARKMAEALRGIGNSKPQNLARLYALGENAATCTKPGENGIEEADFPARFDPPYVA